MRRGRGAAREGVAARRDSRILKKAPRGRGKRVGRGRRRRGKADHAYPTHIQSITVLDIIYLEAPSVEEREVHVRLLYIDHRHRERRSKHLGVETKKPGGWRGREFVEKKRQS